MRSAVAIALLLLSCCDEPKTGSHHETIDAALSKNYGMSKIDKGIDLLVSELAVVIDDPKTKIDSACASLAVADEIKDSSGELQDGVVNPFWFCMGVTARWVPGNCLSDTALLYEIAHGILCRAGDCRDTIEESRHDVVLAVRRANSKWKPVVCD